MKKYHAICEHCGKPFNEWYCLCGGGWYYCSDECLNAEFTKEAQEELDIWGDNSDSYRTERECEEDMFYDENGEELEEEPDTDTLRDLLLKYEIATEQELQLITNINWYSEETLLDVLFCRTGNRTRTQYKEENL